MVVSLAYFLYDFACCLVVDPDLAGIVHHACTTAGLVVGVVQGKARARARAAACAQPPAALRLSTHTR
jgi:hypothetical protein